MTRCAVCDHNNPPGAKQCANCRAELPDALESSPEPADDDLMTLISRGQKIEAIKVYRLRMGVGLKEAKDAVEALERGESLPPPHGAAEDPDDSSAAAFEQELLALLRQGRKIEAIKVYRDKTRIGLADAKTAVERLAIAHGLPVRTSGCAGVVLCLALLALFVAWIAW